MPSSIKSSTFPQSSGGISTPISFAVANGMASFRYCGGTPFLRVVKLILMDPNGDNAVNRLLGRYKVQTLYKTHLDKGTLQKLVADW